jgi:hypothetical protein
MKKIILFLSIFVFASGLIFGQATGYVIADQPSGGTILTATINAYTNFNLNQTTAGQTIAVGNPTNPKMIYLRNIGSVPVTISPGGLLPVGKTVLMGWTGSTWSSSLGAGDGTYLPLAGGNMTGNIVFADNKGITWASSALAEVSGGLVMNTGAFTSNATTHTVNASSDILLNSSARVINVGQSWFSNGEAGLIFDVTGLNTSNKTVTWQNASGTVALTSDISALSSVYQPLDPNLTSWAGVTRASGFDAFVATPSSVNLKSLVTDETGSGALVFANTPTLVTPILGTPISGNLANCTGLPFSGLTSLTSGNILVGNGSNVATSVAMSGDATLNNAGAITLSDDVRVYTTKISLTSSQILNLNSTPITLLAAPGSGKTYEVLGILTRMNFVSAAYATNTTLQVLYSGAALVVATNSNIINATVDKIGKMALAAISAAGSTQYLENTALNLNVGGGNPTTGDGTLDIYITYKIITL